MKTKYFFLAAIGAITLASCSNDEFIGDNSPTLGANGADGSIQFSYSMPNATRADIAGKDAATILGNNFYVTGTKGTEAETYPTSTLVFDNYLVHYGINTAGTTESNTANWEYVGVVPGTAPTANYVKLGNYQIGDDHAGQTIKYWDYSVDQYDFLAFSTGIKKAVAATSGADDEIGVTAMKYGSDLGSSGIAYTFDIPNVACLENTYISDITEVPKASFGNDVILTFKNLGSKVRIALYETIPGYSVKNVVFYKVDGTTAFTDGDDDPDNDDDFKSSTAALISADTYGLPTDATIDVYFPHVGTKYESTGDDPKTDYDKAAATVTPVTTNSVRHMEFGALENFQSSDKDETSANYLGRNLTQATFAGVKNESYYTTVFPVSSSAPLTLRVDYTLVPIDGTAETIQVKGAKAVVPSTYTVWLPNYAYTYIFKISDNTNGYTGTGSNPAGLFPITFDAVVTEATDATGEQTTITTVSAPSITTYQQGHNTKKDEYSKGTGNDIFVQVMHEYDGDHHLVGSTDCDPDCALPKLNVTSPFKASLLYKVSEDDATEAEVMDALQKRSDTDGAGKITGRNTLELTPNANIDNGVVKIVNGVDDNEITVNAGDAAKITIGNLDAGTYAYVYDYTTTSPKTIITEYQIIDVSGGTVGVSGKSYKSLLVSALTSWDDGTTTTHYSAADEDVDNAYIYFSITKNGTGTTTYSYFSVAGKSKVPAGLLKYPKASVSTTIAGGSAKADGTFYFDVYDTNNGKYAVKVIKIVA